MNVVQYRQLVGGTRTVTVAVVSNSRRTTNHVRGEIQLPASSSNGEHRNLFFPRIIYTSTTSPFPQQQCRSEAIREVVVDSEGVIEEEDRLEEEAEVILSRLRAQEISLRRNLRLTW